MSSHLLILFSTFQILIFALVSFITSKLKFDKLSYAMHSSMLQEYSYKLAGQHHHHQGNGIRSRIGHFGRIGRLSVKVEKHVLECLREFGLALFLLGAGSQAGSGFVEILKEQGALLFLPAPPPCPPSKAGEPAVQREPRR